MFPDISCNVSIAVRFPVYYVIYLHSVPVFSSIYNVAYLFSVKYHYWPHCTTLLFPWDFFSMQSIIHIVWHSVILSYLIKYNVYSLNYIQESGWSTNHPRDLLQHLNISLKMIYNILSKLLNVKDKSIYLFINLIF